jgi:hypothetical protein
MISFLLGIVFSVCLMAAGYLIFRTRWGKPRGGRAPEPRIAAKAPQLQFSGQEEHAQRDLMNLESAFDLKKVLREVADIKRAEDARKG